ncbi:MAG: beta-ketoacyl-[acyl-carrier-protein] synthase family protein [bacterium]|nr:beta-ketoacyl-[acyl-carrier-protein] synthase family protein [bacterium]
MSLKKVVITGLGIVSPFGLGIETLMRNLYSGSSAVCSQKEVWNKNIKDLNCWIGAPLKEELPIMEIPRKLRRTMGRSSLMSYIAVKEALASAQMPEDCFTSGRTGVSFSSTTGSVSSISDFFNEYVSHASLKNVSSGSFFQIMSHSCAANIAHAFNIKGRVMSPDSACSSSAQAMGLAFESVKYGMQDIMICGGADELDAVVCGTFDLLNATSSRFNDSPASSPRPFDRDRDGTVCGEGAGCIIMESEKSALSRNAPILAEVVGFHTSSDGTHIAQPHSESIASCIKGALNSSGILTSQIGYINAHATGTPLGDKAEAAAIAEVLGGKTPVSSLKGHLGHTLGASGAIELAATIRMINDRKLIPTKNLSIPDVNCANIMHVKTDDYHKNVEYYIKNSFAFGGINAVLILRRHENSNESR